MSAICKKIGAWETAIAQYKSALKIKPDYAEAYAKFSLPHLLQGSLEEGLNLH